MWPVETIVRTRACLCILHTALHPSYTFVLSPSNIPITLSVFLFPAKPFLFFHPSSFVPYAFSFSPSLFLSFHSAFIYFYLNLFFPYLVFHASSLFLLVLVGLDFASSFETRISNLFLVSWDPEYTRSCWNSEFITGVYDFHSPLLPPKTLRRIDSSHALCVQVSRESITMHWINPIFFFFFFLL